MAIKNNSIGVDEILNMLPQGKVIKPHHAKKWLDTMQRRNDFHDIGWHVARLKGIGGSESVVALQKYYAAKGKNLPDPFADPRSLVMQKLMMYVPSEASPKMLRGNRFEDLIIERFCEQYNATVRQDMMDAVAEQSGKDEAHPWLVGNPDLIAEIAGKTFLIDIKAPDEAHTEFPFRYVVQLHHYREIMKRAGIVPHGMILANFSWKDYAVKALKVDFDQEIARGIIEGGDLLWDDVMNGRVPELITFEDKKTPIDENVIAELKEEEQKYLRWKLIAEEVEKRLEAHAEHIRSLVAPWSHEIDAKHGLVKGLDLLTLQSRKKVNEDELKALLQTRGLNEKWEEVTKPVNRYDVEAMKKALEEAGVDPDQFRVRTVDTQKAVEVLQEQGITPQVLNESGVIEWSPSPVFRKPSRGPRVEKFANVLTEVQPVSEALEKIVEDGGKFVIEHGFSMDAVLADNAQVRTHTVEQAANKASSEETDAPDAPEKSDSVSRSVLGF